MVAVTNNDVENRRQFQVLKNRLHRQMVDAIDMSKAGELGEEEFRRQLQALAGHLCSQQAINLQGRDRDQMVRELMDEIYGFGPLQALMSDPEVSDVLVNGADAVFVERNGMLQRTNVRFADDQHLLQFIQRLVGHAGRRIDEVYGFPDA